MPENRLAITENDAHKYQHVTEQQAILHNTKALPMQLKRLEISGFKSFADKCAIDFPPGISAIVGPNGCGKSNIIDAIKWVMGEQSVKQLRGKAMGDVIFAGTDKRAQLNMAEVSLVIAGHDSSAIENIGDYTEIMITRRLYRSGESNYLINRQPCRLKDINDIFLRYSMGSRSCAIIQQGNIGAITDTSAEERRTFIEEAAGVVRYKARKQEAMAKVNATRQNLLRLKDILKEIENRLAELSFEAEKARRYQDGQASLKNADMLISTYYHDQYTQKIESTETLLHQLNEKTAYKSEEIKALHAALQEIESQRQEKEQKIADKKAQKAKEQQTTEKLEYDRKHLQNEESRLSAENIGHNRSLEQLSSKNLKTDKELADEYQKRKTFQERILSLKSEIDVEKQVTSEHKEKLSEQTFMLDEKKERLMEMSSQHARHQNIFQNAAVNSENLERRMNRIEKEMDQAGTDVSNLADKETETRTLLENIVSNLEILADQTASCQSVLKTKNADLSEKIKEGNRLDNERSKYKARLGMLKKMESGFEWYKDGVKAIMKSRTGPDDQGRILGIAAEIIEPVPGFEKAVEAAMGEALQYIIVNGHDAGVDYIDFLKKEKAGRSGFIPLDHCNDKQAELVTPSNDGSSHPCMIANHVDVHPDFEAAFKNMLSGIAVVDDIDQAILMWQNEKPLKKIVTRQGDIVSAEGFIVGGSSDQLAGILEKKQEIRNIQKEIDSLDETIGAEKESQKKLEVEVKGLENRLSDLIQKKFKHETDHREAEKTLYKTAEQLKHARRQMEISGLEKIRLEGEKEDIVSEMEHHEQILAEMSYEIETEKSEISRITSAIENLRETLRTFDNRTIDLKLDLTRLEAELNNTNRTISRLNTFKNEGADQYEQLQKIIASCEQQKDETSAKIISCESAYAEAVAALKQIQLDLKEEESGYRTLVDKQKNADHSIYDAKTEMEKTRETIHKLELKLSGLQINRENTVNRFLERYPEPFSTVLSQFRENVVNPAFSIEKVEKERLDIRTKIEEIGDVNLGAITAYEQQKARYDFLVKQQDDLEKALADLENVIQRINRITRKLFIQTFDAVNLQFKALFPRLFNGGSAWLELTRPDLPLETGVELMIQPPGKKLSRLSLLSGGEKALSAIAFIFSIFMLNPASFCLLDEIDAPLDDVNVYRFNELLRIIGESTQIIMISHNKKTMEFSDMLFGITVARSGGSRMISVNMDQALEIECA